MRALIQRVKQASVAIFDKDTKDDMPHIITSSMTSSISKGLLVYVCMEERDTDTAWVWMARKLYAIRLFDDAKGLYNYSVRDIQGDLLIIPNFTLLGNAMKGNRPNFFTGIQRAEAHKKFDAFMQAVVSESKKDTLHTPSLEKGQFGAYMEIEALIDGPTNIILDTP